MALVVYHFAVRRFGPLRVLFGMRGGRARLAGDAGALGELPASARGPLGGPMARGKTAP
jgi:hypothetical protein